MSSQGETRVDVWRAENGETSQTVIREILEKSHLLMQKYVFIPDTSSSIKLRR